MLVAGVDPLKASLTDAERSLITVTRRAITEAVDRANQFAWTHARELDRLSLQSRKNKGQIAVMRLTPDIWEISVSAR
jgi:hypothetical protein